MSGLIRRVPNTYEIEIINDDGILIFRLSNDVLCEDSTTDIRLSYVASLIRMYIGAHGWSELIHAINEDYEKCKVTRLEILVPIQPQRVEFKPTSHFPSIQTKKIRLKYESPITGVFAWAIDGKNLYVMYPTTIRRR